MKRILILCFLIVLVGCTYEGKKISTYVDSPRTLLEDPLSVDHQQALDNLESDYLQKKITYAEYLKEKQQLEDDYTREVQSRRDIIENVDQR